MRALAQLTRTNLVSTLKEGLGSLRDREAEQKSYMNLGQGSHRGWMFRPKGKIVNAQVFPEHWAVVTGTIINSLWPRQAAWLI
jgi:hypothetical protein